MIVTEYYMTRSDGVVLNRTYSDDGKYIVRDGISYSEAIDPAELNRQYMETDKLVEDYTDEATEADYQSALSEFGVKV